MSALQSTRARLYGAAVPAVYGVELAVVVRRLFPSDAPGRTVGGPDDSAWEASTARPTVMIASSIPLSTSPYRGGVNQETTSVIHALAAIVQASAAVIVLWLTWQLIAATKAYVSTTRDQLAELCESRSHHRHTDHTFRCNLPPTGPLPHSARREIDVHLLISEMGPRSQSGRKPRLIMRRICRKSELVGRGRNPCRARCYRVAESSVS
jgi:hypothetical protein